MFGLRYILSESIQLSFALYLNYVVELARVFLSIVALVLLPEFGCVKTDLTIFSIKR